MPHLKELPGVAGEGGLGGGSAGGSSRRSGGTSCLELPVTITRMAYSLPTEVGASTASAAVVTAVAPFASALPVSVFRATGPVGAVNFVAPAPPLVTSAILAVLPEQGVSPSARSQLEDEGKKKAG